MTQEPSAAPLRLQ